VGFSDMDRKRTREDGYFTKINETAETFYEKEE
jgi:hypothetical protein